MIDPKKKYRTRDGRKVIEITRIPGNIEGEYYAFLVKLEKGISYYVTDKGYFGAGGDGRDLIEITEESTQMKQPHKHAELIKAWADGAEIEYFSGQTGVWEKVTNPSWYTDAVYRIKPAEPEKTYTIDQPVWVRFFGDTDWYPRHYAKYKDGKHRVYVQGQTSHTSDPAKTTRVKEITDTDPTQS